VLLPLLNLVIGSGMASQAVSEQPRSKPLREGRCWHDLSSTAVPVGCDREPARCRRSRKPGHARPQPGRARRCPPAFIKVRIIGDFESPAQMRFEPMLTPDAAHGARANLHRLGHGGAVPLRASRSTERVVFSTFVPAAPHDTWASARGRARLVLSRLAPSQ